MREHEVTVIIPTYNRPKSLSRTIISMISADCLPNQLIIVDQSAEIYKEQNKLQILEYSSLINIVYIEQDTPSITKARNKGLEYCSNDIIVFCDDDVDFGKTTISEVHSIMNDGNIAMIAGVDENYLTSKTVLSYLFNTKSIINRRVGHVTLSMHGRFPQSMELFTPTQWAMGFFFVVRKSMVVKWNIKWDENLTSYAYAEDLDFSFSYYKKACQEKKKCIITDKVKVKHLVSDESRIPSFRHTCMYVINREYLSYKHFRTPLSRLATRWSNFGMFLQRLIDGNAPYDLIKAQIICDKNRHDIKKGILHNELYID